MEKNKKIISAFFLSSKSILLTIRPMNLSLIYSFVYALHKMCYSSPSPGKIECLLDLSSLGRTFSIQVRCYSDFGSGP